ISCHHYKWWSAIGINFYVNILIILYDELVFNQFFYYLFIFYVLCKITFEQRHILVYNAKENCYHGTGKGVLI
ncbi:MAG TPA: hypothetical protein DCZ53_01110, partial [Ruminococcus sp.]|nr:hypothetical protein [Ruminococcus sp.]